MIILMIILRHFLILVERLRNEEVYGVEINLPDFCNWNRTFSELACKDVLVAIVVLIIKINDQYKNPESQPFILLAH